MTNKEQKDAIENASDEAGVEKITGGNPLPEGMRGTLSQNARNRVDAVQDRKTKVDPKAIHNPTPQVPSRKSTP